ncbi:MAG: RNA pyrophosphohydrolase [Phreatobacter sp.]|uniref:RNA pyrophosphohydrolase n=1 Tax=Phreatobacter sp. TaxID=1966341 RepID=UPI001A422EBF|nr:RNA pyrophosphohydrolase [Phreatobacter sp.]MBL8570494.1 RNA pyrophosphohydrolase [Phreatobacter sp.]
MTRFEDLPYRPCVGVVLLNRQGLAFIGRRADATAEHGAGDTAWQMPQGGIDPGEEPLAAATRELFEETNVRSATLLAEAPEWFAYDLPQVVAGQSWKGKYRGQTQKWFAFRFDGEDGEINVARPGDGHHKPEFDRWRWETLDALPGLIIPFKRGVYEQVAATFRPFAHPV